MSDEADDGTPPMNGTESSGLRKTGEQNRKGISVKKKKLSESRPSGMSFSFLADGLEIQPVFLQP